MYILSFSELRSLANFSAEENVRICGDPLEHDVIVSFGNEGDHWYVVIIDNRLLQKKVF